MKTTKKKPTCDRWTPVRHGDTYCSPACGYGCTHLAFLNAHAKAKALAKELGANWKPRVWENLGWHYAVYSKGNFVKIHPSQGSGWIGFFGWPGGSGGNYTAHGKTLQQVLRAGLKRAKADLAEAAAVVAGIESAIK